jgi:glycosyltransferase involved in cell wall biosynthesis
MLAQGFTANARTVIRSPMISLIVATVNRVSEVERFLGSLDRQTYIDFEVIVVDQNPDDRLLPIIQQHQRLSIQHLRSRRGLSRARNVGLPHSKGEIIGFPDDDCWYPEQLLARVKQTFDLHPESGAIFATLRDAEDRPIGPKWPDHACFWTKEDVWFRGISPAGFMRREVADAIGAFNEKIGIGASTAYQSGEDVDYFVRPLGLGWQIWYEPTVIVHHPPFHNQERIRERSYSYALGGGYTLRVHHYPVRRLLEMLLRSAAGAAVHLLRGDFLLARSYLLRAAGLLRGYFFGPSDLKRLSRGSRFDRM